MNSSIGPEQSVPLPGPIFAVAQFLPFEAGYLTARFRDQDMPRGDVPVVEILVSVEIHIRFAARHLRQLDARGVGFDDSGGVQCDQFLGWFVWIAGMTLGQRRG